MARQWNWETADSDWGVELDEHAGMLRWHGVDKVRPGVSAHGHCGGEIDQRVADLLSTGRPSYACPPHVLAEVVEAARRVPVRAKLPALDDASIDAVARICQAAMRTLTGNTGPLPETRRQVSVEDIPDDRPTQTSGTRYVTEVRFGERVLFLCTEEVGGWCQGSALWNTADFAGTGRLRLDFESGGVEIEGAPAVVEVIAALLRANASPASPVSLGR